MTSDWGIIDEQGGSDFSFKKKKTQLTQSPLS
jgi:hypothetical protein